ncbi:YtxH domain-containing protein [bacterium]|nr:YtxH domain-containing protein [bacterium]
MSKDSKSMAFPLGLLAGVVGGIVAGVLFAPKPGKETREELVQAASEFYEKHSPEINNAKKQAMDSVELLKCKLEKQIKTFADTIKSRKMRKAKEKENSEFNQ